MVDIVPPLRVEPLFDEFGNLTVRYAEYLSKVSVSIDVIESNIDILSSIDSSTAITSQRSKDIEDNEITLSIDTSSSGIARLNKDVEWLGVELSVDKSSAAISQLKKRIDDLELVLDLSVDGKLAGLSKKFTVVEITADHTTTGNEIVICSNTTSITVTLRTPPNDQEEVHIVTKLGQVSFISADGVNGSTSSVSILGQYSSPHLIYTNLAAEWSIV